MSMHKIPLTKLERDGLEKHGLNIGIPSQLSDVFRQGVAWAISNTQKLSVNLTHMKESNGNEWWNVVINKSEDSKMWDGYVVYNSKIKGRAEYEADRLRYFLGLIEKEPFILDYDTDAPNEG